jgi:hypothetical protein
MQYQCPYYNDLGGIGAPMNPLFVQESVAFGPTRVIDVPTAGYAQIPRYGLDGWRDAMDVFSAAAFLFPA